MESKQEIPRIILIWQIIWQTIIHEYLFLFVVTCLSKLKYNFHYRLLRRRQYYITNYCNNFVAAENHRFVRQSQVQLKRVHRGNQRWQKDRFDVFASLFRSRVFCISGTCNETIPVRPRKDEHYRVGVRAKPEVWTSGSSQTLVSTFSDAL